MDRLFLVGFARVTSEPGVLSQRCTTPAFGQGSYAVLLGCLITKTLVRLTVGHTHHMCSDVCVWVTIWRGEVLCVFCENRRIRHATHPLLPLGINHTALMLSLPFPPCFVLP